MIEATRYECEVREFVRRARADKKFPSRYLELVAKHRGQAVAEQLRGDARILYSETKGEK